MRRFIDIIEGVNTQLDLPTVSFSKLWHVGYMRLEDKRDGSLEGAGLSVSRHPDAWRQISPGQVDGNTYLCTKPGNAFVDAYALSPQQNEMLGKWGENFGYAEPGKVWSISAYDPHIESWTRSTYGNRLEFEKDWNFHQRPENVSHKAKFTMKDKGWASTQKLDTRVRSKGIDARHTLDMLLTVYVEDVLSCDGVWWKDRLSPDNLSAPRGVIVPSRVSNWSFSIEKTEDEYQREHRRLS